MPLTSDFFQERIKEITDQLHALEGDAREVLDKKERANEAKSEAAAAVSKLQQEKKQVADEHKKLELATVILFSLLRLL